MHNQTPNTKPRWTPPHCPNPDCPGHDPGHVNWRYRRRGSFRRKRPPHIIPRYQCLICMRTFSNQTFCTTYWLKRPELQLSIAELAVGGMANRQIARTLRCAPATVDLHLSRVGRHCLLFERQLPLPPSTWRDIVADGLATFELSQFFPFEFLAAVDKNSSYLLHFTIAPLRRSGRMTAEQKVTRAKLEAELGKPDPKAVEKGMREVFQEAARGADAVDMFTDEHQAYPRAMRSLPCPYTHHQTSSKARRDCHNPLFEINLLDMFTRHSTANHRRETIAFAKRRQGAAERIALFMVWRNWVKWRREKKCRQTPAMLLGRTNRRWQFEDILSQRLFPGHLKLPASWREIYWSLVETRALHTNRKHTLKFAF
jgi:transposase-like protein